MTTAADMLELLAAKFPLPGHLLLSQVRNGTGFVRQPRTADALAMGLWPSRGLHLHGFEVKVDRGDWLRELKEPAKAEEMVKRCHFWSIVAPEHVVRLEELPVPWGLLVPRGRALATAKLPHALAPPPASWGFVAELMRRSSEQSPHAAQANLKAEQAETRIEERVAARVDTERREIARQDGEARQTLARLTEAIGLHRSIQSWEVESLGWAIRALHEGGGIWPMGKRLGGLAAELRRMADEAEVAAKTLAAP